MERKGPSIELSLPPPLIVYPPAHTTASDLFLFLSIHTHPYHPNLSNTPTQENIDLRHRKFEQDMTRLQAVLTPTQRARLVLWATQ